MVTKIQSLHFDADQRLVMLVEEKIEKLKHYFKADASALVKKSSRSGNPIIKTC